MSAWGMRLPSRPWPRLAEERAKTAHEAVAGFLAALDDEFSDAGAPEEREWCEQARRSFADWLDGVAAEAQSFRLPEEGGAL